jgi:hypothetical protein
MPFLMPLIKWAASFITGPIFADLLEGYKAKLAAGNTSEKLAGDLAGRELQVQQVETLAQNQLKIAEIGHPWEPEKLAFYITLLYYAKIVIWDVMFQNETHGNTDPLHGQAAVWAQMIMAFYFGKRTFENVSRIITRKWGM